MSHMSLDDDFHEAMIDLYHAAGRRAGHWARYHLRDVRRHGGVRAARRMLRPRAGGATQKGLQALIDAGLAHEISVEALVLEPRFSRLFTDAERGEAARRLAALPGYAKRRPVPPSEVHPETLRADAQYREGTSIEVKVNAYERSATARAACIARHGCRCAVCDLKFESRYGPIGKDFIHVHHKKPLAGMRAEYQVDPVKDLMPVCPNCHAMLHTSDPPLSVDELKQHMAEAVAPKQRRARGRRPRSKLRRASQHSG
jgi:5-methylcytosine-specific restriction protein A